MLILSIAIILWCLLSYVQSMHIMTFKDIIFEMCLSCNRELLVVQLELESCLLDSLLLVVDG